EVERQRETRERLDELHLRRIARGTKHIDAATGAIERKDAPFGSNRHGMHAVELARSFAEAAKLGEVGQVAIEDHHAVIVETVGDQHAAIRQKRDILRLAEMR